MLLLFILCILSKAIQSEDVQCDAYSFTEDLYRKFSSKGCDKSNSWSIVNYEAIGMIPAGKTLTGLKTTEQSCASSFPIGLIHGGNLQVTFFAENCGVTMKIFEENTNRVIAEYNDFIKSNYLTGWSTISMKIKTGVEEGYITFSGYCENNGFLLIDSFQYLPPGVPKSQCYFNHEQEFKDGEFILINNIKAEKSNLASSVDNEIYGQDRDEEGSGLLGPEDGMSSDEDEPSFWNPLTISVVAIGGFTGLGALSYGAYQFGKIKGAENDFLDVEQLEPPRAITLPRVRSVYSGNPGNVSGRLY